MKNLAVLIFCLIFVACGRENTVSPDYDWIDFTQVEGRLATRLILKGVDQPVIYIYYINGEKAHESSLVTYYCHTYSSFKMEIGAEVTAKVILNNKNFEETIILE